MSYVKPSIKAVRMGDVLAQLGPARALLYSPGDAGGDDGGLSGGSMSGGSGSGGSGSGSSGGSGGSGKSK